MVLSTIAGHAAKVLTRTMICMILIKYHIVLNDSPKVRVRAILLNTTPCAASSTAS